MPVNVFGAGNTTIKIRNYETRPHLNGLFDVIMLIYVFALTSFRRILLNFTKKSLMLKYYFFICDVVSSVLIFKISASTLFFTLSGLDILDLCASLNML